MAMATTPTSHQNEESTTLFLSPSIAITTSPYAHHDTILRYSYLARSHLASQRCEQHAHQISSHNSFLLFVWDGVAAIKIFAHMLFNWQSMLGCALTVIATLIAYYYAPNEGGGEWNSNLPDILLSFAIITPLSLSINMGWSRRETALKALAMYRSAVNNLYVAHAAWDWGESSKGKGRRGCVENKEDEVNVYGDVPSTAAEKKTIDWLNHSDTTLCHLIHLSDSLCQYLTLPSATRARHRATAKGRNEANRVLSTGREIFTLTVCGRMSMLSQMCEALKYRGLPGNEASRIRNWENVITTAMEELRNVKEYRTLQALRVYERLFCFLLPPFFASNYAQVAFDTNLFLGIATGVITSIALTGLFECVRTLEDPFVSNLTLDGIDVREELVVLAHQELMVSRKMWFPKADDFVLTTDFLKGDNAVNDAREMYRKSENRMSRHFSSSLHTKE